MQCDPMWHQIEVDIMNEEGFLFLHCTDIQNVKCKKLNNNRFFYNIQQLLRKNLEFRALMQGYRETLKAMREGGGRGCNSFQFEWKYKLRE